MKPVVPQAGLKTPSSQAGLQRDPHARGVLKTPSSQAGLQRDPHARGVLKTPSSQGFAMPAEWARHDATWLSWPHNTQTWPGKRLAKVRDIYLQIIETLLPSEKVKLLLAPALKEEALRFLKPKLSEKSLKNLIFIKVPTADAWIRDYGPAFVVKKREKAWCKWTFNAWGGKYKSLAEDDRIFSPQGGSASIFSGENKKLIEALCFNAAMVLEGGSIEVNGAGTCMTTEQCLLNKNRNPQLLQLEIEAHLKEYLGVSQVLWLNEGLAGDDTDGHIDDVARFADEKTILAAYEEDDSDENYSALRENWERLRTREMPDGKKWNVIKLPMPASVADGGKRLPASYANFYIANETVLLPVYACKQDQAAVRILKEVFPKRDIVPIECTALVYGLGALHCVTQQEPSVS